MSADAVLAEFKDVDQGEAFASSADACEVRFVAGQVKGATVRETSPEGWVTVALSGRFELDAKDDPSYPRWFRGSLDGALEYHLLTAELRRFELLAEGQTEGSGRYTPGAPEGPYRLRVACELPPDAFAVDVPPQGSRSVLDYLVP